MTDRMRHTSQGTAGVVGTEEQVPPAAPQPTLLDFLQGLGLEGLDLEREEDRGRELDL